MDINVGDLEVAMPNNYSDRERELALTLNRIQGHLTWNDDDKLVRSLESRVCIEDVGVHISGASLVDTFTINVIGELTIKDSEVISGLKVDSSSSSPTPAVS